MITPLFLFVLYYSGPAFDGDRSGRLSRHLTNGSSNLTSPWTCDESTHLFVQVQLTGWSFFSGAFFVYKLPHRYGTMNRYLVLRQGWRSGQTHQTVNLTTDRSTQVRILPPALTVLVFSPTDC